MNRDDELDREIRTHLELEAEEREGAGMSAADARFAARRAFGNVTRTKEDVRALQRWSWLAEFRDDARHAARMLFKNRGFAAAAIVTLALGIGATTTMFSVVSAVLVPPRPYTNATRIVQLVENVPAEESMSGRALRRASMNVAEFDFWRRNVRTLVNMAVTVNEARTLMTRDGTVRLEGARVSPALFTLRNIPPVLGRGLFVDEERADARVVVLGASSWLRYFGGAPDIVNREIALDGQPYTVVGVMPQAFGDEAFWIPYAPAPTREGTVQFLRMTASLAEDVSTEEATIEANAIGARLRGAPPPAPGAPPRFEVVRTIDEEVAAVRPVLRLLVVAVAVVLLIVCANVANLLLVRGVGRRREIAIRQALGAARGRVFRQLITESFVLSITGGIAGTALALAGIYLVRTSGVIDLPSQFRAALGPSGRAILPRADEIAVDPGVLAFALGLSMVTGLLFGLMPALRLSGVDHRQAISVSDSTIRDAGGGRGSRRVGYSLAVAQLTLATTLLVGSGLLLRSFVNLATVPLGFDASAQIFRLVSPGEYPRSRKLALAHDVAAGLRGLSGVEAAGFVNFPPMTPTTGFRQLFLPPEWEAQRDDLRGADDAASFILSTGGGYLRAMGVTLIDGRWLDEQDTADRPRVVMVNRTWVRRFSPHASPVGMTVMTRGARNTRTAWQIVGVVDDLRLRMDQMSPRSHPLADMPSAAFVDLRQQIARAGDAPNVEADYLIGEPEGLTFAVRVEGASMSMATLRGAVRDIDPRLAVESVATMGDVVGGLIGRQRFYALIVTIFGSIAAIIAAIGVYGVLAHVMTQRRHEFGVRLALGAEPRHVLSLAMRHGVVLVVVGLTAGLSGALALTRYLSGMLFGLTPLDPATYIVVTLAFASVSLLASFVPSRRATRVDPLAALRCE